MNDKHQLLAMLRAEFNRWEALLARLSEEQLTAPQLPSNLSIKDVIGHLRAWQQVSIARLEAALLNREPEMPEWLAGLDPELEDHLDTYNDWIYQAYREQPWSSVHRVWSEGFLRFLQLAEAIPEKDLLATGRYPWLEENPLSAVLEGSYEHHVDHLEPLLARLQAESDLATMAADPDIQREVQQIGAEFAITEMDGLDSQEPTGKPNGLAEGTGSQRTTDNLSPD